MPNWMYNTLSISGEEAEIAKVEKQLATPYERTTYDIGEDKYETRMVEKVISLWNILNTTKLTRTIGISGITTTGALSGM
jgi:hypothetical protein